MSSDEAASPIETLSAALRAATKLTNETEKSDEVEEKLTPEMLATAIKLASLSTDHQEKLTPATVNAALKLAKQPTNDQEQSLTPESLAIALKLAAKAPSHDKNTNELSTDQMLAAMKAAVVMTQDHQKHEPVTSDLLADAIKLAKK